MFKKLFNHIKSSAIAPSFFWRNRLFIERQGQTRRILANLGLTFRNSKWSSYALPNISPRFRANLLANLRYIITGLFLFFITLYFTDYAVLSTTWDAISSMLFVVRDSVLALIALAIFFVMVGGHELTRFVVIKFFERSFKTDSKNTDTSGLAVTNQYLNKNDQKLVLFRWLTQDSSGLGKNLIIKNLFSGLVDQKSWERNYLFFPKLYQLVHIMQIAELTTAHQSLKSSVTRLSTSANKWDTSSLDTLLNNSDVGTRYNALLTDLEVASSGWLKFPKESRRASLKLLNKKPSWGLDTIALSKNANKGLTLSIEGNHFLGTQVTRKLKFLSTEVTELNLLNTTAANQLSVIKQQRWLYKYSLLHREILKNSHKTTQAKRLISSGFYDSSLTSQNLWASSFFKRETASTYDTLIKSALKENYGSNLIPTHSGNALTNLTTSFTNQRTLTNLSSLENSYFWLLKRFFLFNTSPANTPFTKRSLTVNSKASENATGFSFANNQTELKAASDLMLKTYSIVNKGLVINPSRKMSSPHDFNGLDALAGLNLEFSDLDFLSGDNLSLALSLYTPINLPNGKTKYFSVLQYDNSDFTDFEFKDFDVNATYPHSRTHSRISKLDVKVLTDLTKLLSVFK